jgi:hypothetical protein
MTIPGPRLGHACRNLDPDSRDIETGSEIRPSFQTPRCAHEKRSPEMSLTELLMLLAEVLTSESDETKILLGPEARPGG